MPLSLLIIDDDQTLSSLLKDGLEKAGYQVSTALDVPEGLRQATEKIPDLILLDYYMPGGTGGAVHQSLRADPKTAKIPVVFSTGMTLEQLKAQVGLDSSTYFLAKPVALSAVLEVVGKALGRPPRPASSSVEAPVKLERPLARWSEFEVRVTYGDTDKLGVIYYANYFKYFEQGRTELLRSLGVRYRDLEIQRKLYLPAVEAKCQYLAPSRYDDLLIVRTWIAEMGLASVSFECDVIDKDLGGRPVARGFSRHAVVNDLWRNAKIPADLRELLSPFVGRGPS